MNVRADKLAAALSRTLPSVCVIAGDEPLLVAEAADTVRSAARGQGISGREVEFVERVQSYSWERLLDLYNSYSLFSDRSLIELRMPGGKPGRDGAAALLAIAERPNPDKLLLLHLPHLNRKARQARWAQALEQAGIWVDVYPPADLHAWIAGRAAQMGLHCDQEALAMLTARVEGNLLLAQQEIYKLTLLAEANQVDAALVRQVVADGARFDVYQLQEAALEQDAGRALRVLAGLQREGVAVQLVSWSLTQAVATLARVWAICAGGSSTGQALREAGVWQSREIPYQRALAAHDERSIGRLVRQAAAADRTVKGAPGAPWPAMQQLVLALSQPRRAGLLP